MICEKWRAQRFRIALQTGSAHAEPLTVVPRTTAQQPTEAQNPLLSVNHTHNTAPTPSLISLPAREPNKPTETKQTEENHSPPLPFPPPLLPEAPCLMRGRNTHPTPAPLMGNREYAHACTRGRNPAEILGFRSTPHTGFGGLELRVESSSLRVECCKVWIQGYGVGI